MKRLAAGDLRYAFVQEVRGALSVGGLVSDHQQGRQVGEKKDKKIKAEEYWQGVIISPSNDSINDFESSSCSWRALVFFRLLENGVVCVFLGRRR